MNKQEAIKIAFDVLNKELIKPGRGSDTLARAVVDALMPDEVTVTLDNSTGKFTPEPERHSLLGFQIIGDMTKAELIEECVEFQRALWTKTDMDTMKHMVITARSELYKQRLTAEAKLSPPMGFAGWTNGGPVKIDDE